MPIRVVSTGSRFYGEQHGNEAKDQNNSDTKAKIKGDTSPQIGALVMYRESKRNQQDADRGGWSVPLSQAVGRLID